MKQKNGGGEHYILFGEGGLVGAQGWRLTLKATEQETATDWNFVCILSHGT